MASNQPQLQPTFGGTAPSIQPSPAVQSTAPSKSLFGNVSFQQVLDKNPDFKTWSPVEQNELTSKFLDEKTQGFNPDEKLEATTIFNKKYNLGQVDTLSDPLKAINSALTTGTLAAGAVLNPAADAFQFNLGGDSNQQARDMALKQFPGIQTDPGLLGDAYRFNSNQYANNIGGFAGGLANAGKLAAGGLSKYAIPAIQSGITNAGQVLQGNQNPLQALGNTAINSVAGLIPNGRNFLTTALKQGAGGALAGAASSAIGDASNARAVNLPAALRAALEQGAIQAGTGAAFHLPQGEALAQARQAAEQSRLSKNSPVVESGPTPQQVADYIYQQYQDRTQGLNALKSSAQNAQEFSSVNDRSTLQGRATQLKKVYETTDQASRMVPDPVESQALKILKGTIQKQYDANAQEFSSKYGDASKPVKIGKENVANPEDLKALADLTYAMRKQGNLKQADVAMSHFSRETNARVFDEVKRRETIDKQRGSQAKSSNKALNTGISQNQKRASKQLKGDIQSRFKELDAQEKASNKRIQELENQKDKQAASNQLAIEKAASTRRKKELDSLKAYIQQRNREHQAIEKLKIQEAQKSNKTLNTAEAQNQKRENKALKGDIQSRNKTQLQKESQARSDNKALVKGEQKNQRRENRVLRGDIQARYTRKSAQELGNRPEITYQPVEDIVANVKTADKAGNTLVIRYRAEGTGETGQYEYKDLHQPKIIEDARKGTIIKGINNDGQLHEYHIDGQQGSEVVGVRQTGKDSHFERTIDPETGGLGVVDKRTGEIVAQVAKSGVKSSDLRAAFDLAKRIGSDNPPSINEIQSTFSKLGNSQMEEALKQMPNEARTELHEKLTGEPCD